MLPFEKQTPEHLKWDLAMRFCQFLIIFLAISPATTLPAQSDGRVRFAGTVAYLGLDALPYDSTLHIYLMAQSLDGNRSEIVAHWYLPTKGKQIPIRFSVTVRKNLFQRRVHYSLCADISLFEKPMFRCHIPAQVSPTRGNRAIRLNLERVK
jgi:uncharacterized lipoprotein YbaY